MSKITVNQGAPATSTQYLGADRVRTSDGENDTIVDVAAGRYTVINHKKKEYYEFTRDEMDGRHAEVRGSRCRGPMGAMMEKMMGGKVGEVDVQKGAARKIAGYDCTAYTFSLGDNMRYEICAAEALSDPARVLRRAQGAVLDDGPDGARFVKVFDEMKKIKGVPIAMNGNVNVMSIKMNMASEATEVKTGAIPASAFAVPAGYKKKDSPFKG